MAADGTVEWGDEGRPGLLDNVLSGGGSGARLNYPAVGAALLAAGLLVAAEFQPWAFVTGDELDIRNSWRGVPELYLTDLGSVVPVAYYLGWLGLAAMVGLAFAVGPQARRLLVAAGTGWAFALLAMVGSLGRSATKTSVQPGQEFEIALGAGVWFAAGAVVAATVALVLTAWQPGAAWLTVRRRDRSDPGRSDGGDDEGPTDLTVTSVS